MSIYRVTSALLFSLLIGTSAGAQVELVCPCTYTSGDPTSAITTAGIKNTGDAVSGALRILAIVRTVAMTSQPGSITSTAHYAQTLPAGASFAANTAIESGFFAPPSGDYFVYLQVDELINSVWVFQDTVRMQPKQTLDNTGGESAGDGSIQSNGALFYNGELTASISGGSITINLPAITNSSSSFASGNLTLEVGLFESPEYFGQSRFIGATADLGVSLLPKTSATATSIAVPFTPGGAGFDYIHIAIMDNSQNFPVLAWQTVQTPQGIPLVTRNFSLNSIDTLLDTDMDGVSDFNEDLANTDSQDAANVPGASTLDVLAFYTPSVNAIYAGEPEARIIQELAFANQVLTNSGVNAQLQLVGSEEINYSELADNLTAHAAMVDQTGVFSDIAAKRTTAGADLVLLFRPIVSDGTCGIGTLPAVGAEGDFSSVTRDSVASVIYAECRDRTLIHEVGHNMGLAHSVRGPADPKGTFSWSRGHGIDGQFYTIMADFAAYPAGSESLLFSNPNISCGAAPCGVERTDPNIAADAVLSLNTVRFQVAAFAASSAPDSDGDGVPDDQDAFPNDPAETLDTDGDGIGNNADTDDDGDGMPDSFENDNSFDPLDDGDADDDADGDGATNLEEYLAGTNPNDAGSVQACDLDNITPPLPSDSALAIEKLLYVANPGSNITQQTFLRFINANNSATNIEVYGIDDNGARSQNPPISFTLAAQASLQFNAQDLENGNTNKGLTSNLCNGKGKWQLVIRSDQTIQVMGLIRTPDGFLTSLNDVVPTSGMDNLVYFANPASNPNQQTFLRIVNTSAASGMVTISGIDDNGMNSLGTITFNLSAYESKQINAQELEGGNVNKGLTGSLGNGAGKWRLTVNSTLALKTMSLIRTPDGFLTNLSGMVDVNNSSEYVIYFGNSADITAKQTFLRIINVSNQTGTVTMSAIDDAGQIAPAGNIQFSLGPNQSKQMNAGDLETGNVSKGLMGMFGDGSGRWRITVNATTDIRVMSLVRTPDGFLTNLSRTTPVSGNVNTVYFFNPASNITQVSSLRIVNDSNMQADVTISGIDDQGNPAPGGDITVSIPANFGISITAQDLENGNAQLGLVGALGNGAGKWRLEVNSTADLKVQGLMNTPSGFLTNISRVAE